MINEFHRSKLLIEKYANKQHVLGLEKIKLENDIMEKVETGEDDSEDWKKLKEIRLEIDCLAEEKLQIITKLYNLS